MLGTQNSNQMYTGVWKIFQMTNFTMPNNISFMKYALKSVPGFADVGVPHGDGNGPNSGPRVQGYISKFQKFSDRFCFIHCSHRFDCGLSVYDLHLEHGVNGGGYTCLSLAALRGITTQTKQFFIDTFGRHFSQTKDNDSAGVVTIFRRFS